MNYKALALGAVIGFVVALMPACGGGNNECGPANCSGCCDANGTCVETASQTINACGASGNACTTCAVNQQCTAGACTTTGGNNTDGGSNTTDGGGGGGCGPSTCPNGCCTASGLCLPGTANLNCGAGGQACTSCPSGQSCSATQGGGACTGGGNPDGGGGSGFGNACMNDTDCASIGTGAICKKQTSSGNATYEGGYCTKICANANDCGSNAICISVSPFGEGDSICADKCNMQTDPCRSPGYACYPIQNTSDRVCWISPLPEPDAGPSAPDNLIGSACMQDTECQASGQFPGGYCIPEIFTLPDGGMIPTGYTDGYCAADCSVSPTVCGNTGICLGFQAGDEVFYECQDLCTSPNAGQDDCRTGYVCTQYGTRLPDGGVQPSTDGFCNPSCHVTGCQQGTCGDAGYCQ